MEENPGDGSLGSLHLSPYAASLYVWEYNHNPDRLQQQRTKAINLNTTHSNSDCVNNTVLVEAEQKMSPRLGKLCQILFPLLANHNGNK